MASNYPSPLIVPPRSLPHTQTFILLHGWGSSGEKFGSVLLDTHISSASETTASPAPATSYDTLAAAFPHTRFVFPTAARRRATVYRRSYTNQWFDNWKLDPPATEREELQISGLHEPVSYLHNLLRTEIDIVPGGRL
jgi:predicted esterase